jgi:hypothetical protein
LNIDFRPTTQRDAAALSDFLGRVFRSRAGASLLDQEHMGWKYWTARPDWKGPRSFTAQHQGAIVAHAAVWPVRMRVSGQEVTAVQAIDWAADRKYPGVGIWLLRQIAAKVRMMVAIDGSDIARSIFPVIGFRPQAELYQFARAVRPLAHALNTAERNWKLPARLLQDSFWRLWRPLSLPRGWSATPLAPEEVPEGLWPRPSPNTAVTARGRGFYRYFVDSPFAQHVLFGLHKDREPAGYFCLAFAPHAARIADLWLPSANVEDWCAGFQTAAVVAASQKRVYEVSAWASTVLGKEALSRAGFLLRGRSPVSLFGDARILEGRALHLQMLDSDASSCMGKPCPARRIYTT